MACDADGEPSASTSAPAAETIEQQPAELESQLDAIIESYESQRTQLADACCRIDETIIGREPSHQQTSKGRLR